MGSTSFGEENINYFLNYKGEKKFSDALEILNEHSSTKDTFSIPIYACADTNKDPTSNKYRIQRKRIKKIYKNKKLVDVTLKELQKD